MTAKFDVVIAGAGMVGLTAASLFARNDSLNVLVVDAGPFPDHDDSSDIDLRVSAISPGSAATLDGVGAWVAIEGRRACPYRAMRVWDAAGYADGPETLTFDAASLALPELGHIVENQRIRQALIDRLTDTRVRVSFASPIAEITRRERRFEVTLADGEVLRPELLVGADGAQSLVRQAAGIPVDTWSYAQKALVTHLSTERPHRHTAWQRFLEDGPVGMLPFTDGRISVVWSTTEENAEAGLSMTDEALSERLTEITDHVLGKLTVDGPRGAFPLRAQHASTYAQDGLVLIGDAAHTVHPLAGQGVNLGIADASALFDAVDAALASGEYPGDLPTLRRYERARRGDNQTMLRFIDGLNRLFSNRSTALARLRGVGMYLFNHSGPVRDRAVQTALGLR